MTAQELRIKELQDALVEARKFVKCFTHELNDYGWARVGSFMIKDGSDMVRGTEIAQEVIDRIDLALKEQKE